jgi:hypothetical protein
LESGSPRAYHSGKICVGTTAIIDGGATTEVWPTTDVGSTTVVQRGALLIGQNIATCRVITRSHILLHYIA